jgi:hypothetical protein
VLTDNDVAFSAVLADDDDDNDEVVATTALTLLAAATTTKQIQPNTFIATNCLLPIIFYFLLRWGGCVCLFLFQSERESVSRVVVQDL